MRYKNIAYAFLITIGQLACYYLIFGCWLEEFDAVFHSFFAGIYTLPPYEMVNIDVYAGIIPFLSRLADIAYPLPADTWLFYAVTAGAGFIINYFALITLENASAPKVNRIITFIIFSFLAIPQFIVLLNCARTSVLLCIAAFFASAWSFTVKRNNALNLILVVLLLAIGSVVRIFTACIATGLLLALAFFLWRFKFLRGKFGLIFIIFFLIQAGLILRLLNYRAHSSNPGERYVMNYEYAITNRNDLFPLETGASIKDSLRYELMLNWLVTDTAALSESFLRKNIRHITISDIIRDRDYLAAQSVVAVITLKGFARQYVYEIFILIGLILMLRFKKRILGIIWMAMIIAMLLLLTIIGSMYDRGFAPFICLPVFGLWLLWMQQPSFYGDRGQYLFLLLSLFASFFSISHLWEIKKENLRWQDASRQFSQTALIDSLYPVVMQSADMVMFSKKAFVKLPLRDNGGIIMLNAGHLSFFNFFNKPYRERFNLDITNGRSLANFIRAQSEKGVVLLTTKERIDLFKGYLKVFYELDLDIMDLEVPAITSPQQTLYFFRIKARFQTNQNHES